MSLYWLVGWNAGCLVCYNYQKVKMEGSYDSMLLLEQSFKSPLHFYMYIHVWKLHMYIMYTYCSLTIMYVYKHIHTHSVFWWMTRGCPLGPECTHIHSFIHSFIHLYLYPPHSLPSIYKNDVLSKSIFSKRF